MPQSELESFRQSLVAADRSGELRFDILDEAALDAILALWSEDAVFEEDPQFPEAGTYRGREAARGYFKGFSAEFERFEFAVRDVVEAPDGRLVMLATESVRGDASGIDVEMASAWVLTMRDGVVVHVRAYLDQQQALDAVGLATAEH
jgi:ketosteroid isomerase-like protein